MIATETNCQDCPDFINQQCCINEVKPSAFDAEAKRSLQADIKLFKAQWIEHYSRGDYAPVQSRGLRLRA